VERRGRAATCAGRTARHPRTVPVAKVNPIDLDRSGLHGSKATALVHGRLFMTVGRGGGYLTASGWSGGCGVWAPGTRDCARVVHMRAWWLMYVCVPPHGEGDGQHVMRPRKSGSYGALAGMAVVGGCPTTMCVGPAVRRTRAVGRLQANEAETGVATGGQTTDRAAPRRSRKTASVLARDDFLPRRSVGGAAHTRWRLSWGATGRWWSLPLSAHLLCATVAYATLAPGLYRPEILLYPSKKKKMYTCSKYI